MTDVLDRGDPSPSVADVRAIVERRTRFDRTGDAGLLLAAASAGAGAIHLAMVPSHWGESVAEGLGFAICGWLQLAFAALVLTRASRALLRFGIVLNLAAIGAWIVSRTAGLPFGAHSGHAESAGFVDLTCVALEGVLVVACAALVFLVFRPGVTARLARSGSAFASIVGLSVLALTTAALASPGARDHATHSHGDAVAGGAAHSHGGDAATSAGHTHGVPSGADDKGLSLVMNGQGEGGGHTHNLPEVALDAATHRQLDAQLAETRLLIDQYPTVKDAEAAGYRRSGPFAPGLGTHYTGRGSLNLDGDMDIEDLAHPTLIYDGIQPNSPLAGFMYMIYSLDTKHGPAGFAGPNDHWHYHTNVCIALRPDGGIDAPLGADTTVSKTLCDKYHGIVIPNTGYMLHVWVVPGYESPQGVFSNVNAKITCSDGTYYMVKPQELGRRASACKNAA